MNKLILKKCKSIILMLLIVPMLLFSYNGQKANAIVGVDDVIIIGGVAVTAYATYELVSYTLQSGGVKLQSSNKNDSDIVGNIATTLIKTGQVANYLSVKTDNIGNKFLTWTNDGLSWFYNKMATDYVGKTYAQGDAINGEYDIYCNNYSDWDSCGNAGHGSRLKSITFIPTTDDVFVNGVDIITDIGQPCTLTFWGARLTGDTHRVAIDLEHIQGGKTYFVGCSGVINTFPATIKIPIHDRNDNPIVGYISVPISPSISQFSTQTSETKVKEVVEVTDPSTGEKKNENRPKIGVPILPGKDSETVTNPDGTTSEQPIEVPNSSNPPIYDSYWDGISGSITIDYPKSNTDTGDTTKDTTTGAAVEVVSEIVKTTEQKIPTTGKPNSVTQKVDEDGNIIQERYYDGDGRASKDIDYTDHGNPKQHPNVPHTHKWDWSNPNKPIRKNNEVIKYNGGIKMKYDFTDLKEDLSIGHEIEFTYNENKYSISNNSNGWYLIKYGDEDGQSFDNYEQLIENAVIDSKNLEEIWNNVVVNNVF
ncbi:hypothetical protein [Clostridium saccharoperbutylacetonicum]|uniref:hypothetical protein n=1 Tax=Clostridium saccharoperbutylacetonicum TaxID=36745 RepID=UPI0039E921F5